MAEHDKREPGRADVKQRERGDPRQHDEPIDRRRQDAPNPDDSSAHRPASRDDDSPWMGGG